MESWVQSWRPRTNSFCVFFHSTCLNYCACHEKVMPGRTKCCTCHAKSSQLWCPKMQPLRKSATGPPNSSDEHVSCTAPATRNASCQILCICPTPAIVFEMLQNSTRFAHSWQGAQSLAPATRNDIWTSKSAPYPWVFCTFDLEMHFAPQRCALFHHLNFQTWSEPGVFFTFWLGIVLRATTACTFSTSQLLKVLRSSSRHNGVQFFNSHLASWLRTRRFSEPTFRLSGVTNHWKTQFLATFLPFHTWIFFLLTLSLFDLLSSCLLFSDSSHLCFSSVHIVGSLTSKLPSISQNPLKPIKSPIEIHETTYWKSPSLCRWPLPCSWQMTWTAATVRPRSYDRSGPGLRWCLRRKKRGVFHGVFHREAMGSMGFHLIFLRDRQSP